MKQLSDRERWLLLAVGLLLALYVFSQYLYFPKAGENRALREKLNAKRLDLKISAEKVKILEKLELEPIENVAKRVTKDQQVIAALQYISKEVSKLKLNLQSIRPRLEEKQVDLANTVFFDITFSGRYNEIYKFLSALERLPILILVDSMEISGTDTSDVRVNMILSVYY
ncbi:MAG: type II secretion system protein GspM [Candidatus Margulisiibacteriota bacterium]